VAAALPVASEQLMSVDANAAAPSASTRGLALVFKVVRMSMQILRVLTN
jgi:hypothetical protein